MPPPAFLLASKLSSLAWVDVSARGYSISPHMPPLILKRDRFSQIEKPSYTFATTTETLHTFPTSRTVYLWHAHLGVRLVEVIHHKLQVPTQHTTLILFLMLTVSMTLAAIWIVATVVCNNRVLSARLPRRVFA